MGFKEEGRPSIQANQFVDCSSYSLAMINDKFVGGSTWSYSHIIEYLQHRSREAQ